MTLWVLGGDARSRYAAEFFKDNGFTVQTYGVPECADQPLPETFTDLVLPFPSFQGGTVRGKIPLDVEFVMHRTNEHSRIFGGQFGAWAEVFEARGARIYDLYGAEPLTTQNAVATAEGAICLAIEHSPITLHGANCLVIGFGRCGRTLADRLQALHAQVTISARKDSDLACAEALGYRTDETSVWRCGLRYDFIFNTVPANIFSQEQLTQLSPSCLIIELASTPGCIAADAQRELNYHLAPGLPGRYSPKAAGSFYAQSVVRILEKEGFH